MLHATDWHLYRLIILEVGYHWVIPPLRLFVCSGPLLLQSWSLVPLHSFRTMGVRTVAAMAMSLFQPPVSFTNGHSVLMFVFWNPTYRFALWKTHCTWKHVIKISSLYGSLNSSVSCALQTISLRSVVQAPPKHLTVCALITLSPPSHVGVREW